MATSPARGAAPHDLVLVYGGRTAEHDISCISARAVLIAATAAGFRVHPVAVGRDGIWRRPGGLDPAGALPDSLPIDGEPLAPSVALTRPSGADAADAPEVGAPVVFPLVHGPLGEDGTLAGLCELVDVPYVGCGVLSSALCMDKAMAKTVAAAAGLPQGRHVALHQSDPLDPDALLAALGAPVFVKPANMGSSVGISKANGADEVVTALKVAAGYDEWIVAEEAVRCREIEVSVLGNLDPRASVPGEVVPSRDFYDYEDKYVLDGARLVVPAPLPRAAADRVRALALEAFRALRCEGMARVDFLFEEGGRGFLCNEINTIPGFTPISMYPKLWEASGLAYGDLIDELVLLALESHSRRRRNTAR